MNPYTGIKTEDGIMGRMIVKGKEFAAARVLCGDSAPENYAASELRKYLAMLGIPEGDGAAVSIREDASFTSSIPC